MRRGLAGLGRAKRADAGERIAIIARRWDRAVPFEEAEKRRIDRAVREYIGGLHAAGESAAILAELAALRLQKLSREAGCEVRSSEADRRRHHRHRAQVER